jgi:hypothetical protein
MNSTTVRRRVRRRTGRNETPPYNYLDFDELRCGGLAPQVQRFHFTDREILFQVLQTPMLLA